MSSFWSKGKNRAVLYGIGALILFGSYVIGAPETGRTARKKSPKRSKLEASVSDSNELQVEAPIVNDPVFPESETSTPSITPQTVAIGPEKNTYPPQTNTIQAWERQNSIPSFESSDEYSADFSYPVEKMNASPEVKKQIVERLLEGPKEYPYESSEDTEINPSDEKMRWDVSGGRNSADTKKKSAFTGLNTETVSSSSNRSVSKPYSSNPIFYSSKKTSTNLENKDDEEISEKSEGIEYDFSIQNPMPSWLADLYKHVHVFYFKKGNGGSLKYPSFNINNENDYLDIRRVIFTPPDWQLGWEEFIKTPLLEAVERHLLPLGVNGVLTIQIQNAHLFDGPGADFMIVENPFCSLLKNGKTELLNDTVSTLTRNQTAQCFPEPAYVEVSDRAEGPFFGFKPCDGKSEATSSACAGVIPHIYKPGMDLRNIGGDIYDITHLKKDKNFQVKYIRITDMSNSTGIVGTQGFDLDAFVPFNMKKDRD